MSMHKNKRPCYCPHFSHIGLQCKSVNIGPCYNIGMSFLFLKPFGAIRTQTFVVVDKASFQYVVRKWVRISNHDFRNILGHKCGRNIIYIKNNKRPSYVYKRPFTITTDDFYVIKLPPKQGVFLELVLSNWGHCNLVVFLCSSKKIQLSCVTSTSIDRPDDNLILHNTYAYFPPLL